ncbi:lipase member J-like [Haemaphysalis longicornis]
MEKGDSEENESLITGQGYPFERHCVVTADGYIIDMHRIPHGRTPCGRPCRRQPILLMSALLTDSTAYVFDLPKQSLGFVLADRKYDVWMGNLRGTTYGKRHRSLDVRSKSFWNFSFHEHAVLDLPAQIDYMLKVTNSRAVPYVGVSQGTLILFTLLSERPEYNAKVSVFAAMAPFNKLAHKGLDVVYSFAPYAQKYLPDLSKCSYNRETLGDISARKYDLNLTKHPTTCIEPLITSTANGFCEAPTASLKVPMCFQCFSRGRAPVLALQSGPYERFLNELLPRGTSPEAVRGVCALPVRTICANLANTFFNTGTKYMNKTRIPVYLCYLPGGTSSKNIIHYAQLVTSKRAQAFDYGPERNMVIYGQVGPHLYNIGKLKTNVGIFWAQGDQLVPPDNVRMLLRELGQNVKLNYFVDDPAYTHTDFITAINNQQVLFPVLLPFLDRYATRP